MRAPRELYGMPARNFAPDAVLPLFRSVRNFLGPHRAEGWICCKVPVTPVCEREESQALVPNAYALAGVSILLQHRRAHRLRAWVCRRPTLASARITPTC